MIVLFLIVFLVLFSFCVTFRLIVLHPVAVMKYLFQDIYEKIKYKKRNEMGFGKIIAYVALFGMGKTLSLVQYVRALYFRYDGKPIWCKERQRFVTQRVQILSNVTLNDVPYKHFESLNQIVKIAEEQHKWDMQNDCITVTLVVGDEFSVQLNSREFKRNFNAQVLNSILTCRHHRISIIYDAQRFNHVDALLRQVTFVVISCRKFWRFLYHDYYDAYELENCTNPQYIKPIKRSGFFVTNELFDAYDTFACVGNLIKDAKAGKMVDDSEILSRQGTVPVGMDNVQPSRKWKRTFSR